MAHEPILPGLQPINIYSILPTVLLFHVRLNGQPAAIGGGQAHRIRLNSMPKENPNRSRGLGQEDQSQGSRETDPGGHAKGISGNHDRNNILRSCLQGKNGVIADAFRSYFTLQQGIREDRRKGYMNLDPCENSTIPRRYSQGTTKSSKNVFAQGPLRKYEHSQQMANEYSIPMSQNTQLYRRDQRPSPHPENTCAHRLLGVNLICRDVLRKMRKIAQVPIFGDVVAEQTSTTLLKLTMRKNGAGPRNEPAGEVGMCQNLGHPPLVITNEIGIDFWTLREAGSIGESSEQDHEVSKAELQAFIGSCARDSVISEACLASNYTNLNRQLSTPVFFLRLLLGDE
ncbi:hypothetical protein CIHG_06958 [Coccidioides immitis H538.4]|uniref:Uncharacterized protein n=2 Tax=Coccidioides immitis TaxID=5501 RepID=A0A0J8RWX0_COCIT|nr:hypothetical protein CIRG_10003 [Coccidioides immitis RMSCC 2394]KMU89287.1 hypothetical protein CIHG_06958 [Coccidioides immitis H538.4]